MSDVACRFDNLAIEMLIDREKQNFAERQAILAAIEARMRAECKVKIGKIYHVVESARYAGRRFLLNGLTFNASYYNRHEFRAPSGIYLAAWGYLERPRKATIGARHGTFNYKATTLPIEWLDPATEESS